MYLLLHMNIKIILKETFIFHKERVTSERGFWLSKKLFLLLISML